MAMLRRYGWGVPSFRRALYSASNHATLTVEDALLPFRRDGSAIKTRDMNLHHLPWPRAELLALGRHDVELRIHCHISSNLTLASAAGPGGTGTPRTGFGLR
jgi:hypothetical protein